MSSTSHLETPAVRNVDRLDHTVEHAAPGTTLERRAAGRLTKPLAVHVAGTHCVEGHACVASDISEGGLYLQVPTALGLSVGERWAVSFSPDANIGELTNLSGATCYATVVRTESPRDDMNMIGAGLRFDQPLFF